MGACSSSVGSPGIRPLSPAAHERMRRHSLESELNMNKLGALKDANALHGNHQDRAGAEAATQENTAASQQPQPQQQQAKAVGGASAAKKKAEGAHAQGAATGTGAAAAGMKKHSISSVTAAQRDVDVSMTASSLTGGKFLHRGATNSLLPVLNERGGMQSKGASTDSSARGSPKALSELPGGHPPLSQLAPADSPNTVAAALFEPAPVRKAGKGKAKGSKSNVAALNATGENSLVGSSNDTSAASSMKKKSNKKSNTVKPPALSLEDEADEKTARSLRNYQAEQLLAQEAAALCTFHLTSASLKGGVGTSASGSESPSEVAESANHSATGNIFLFPAMSPLSTNRGGAISRSETPCGDPPRGMTPALSGANTPRTTGYGGGDRYLSPTSAHQLGSSQFFATHGQGVPPVVSEGNMTISTAYTNAEFFAHPIESALHTPSGSRTAMAILLTGNQSARTSPRGSGQSSPRTAGGSRGLARGRHLAPLTLQHRNGGGGGGFGFGLGAASKTVPNSPRRVLSRSPSPDRIGGGAAGAGGGIARKTTKPESSLFSPRGLLTVPNHIASPTVTSSAIVVDSTMLEPPSHGSEMLSPSSSSNGGSASGSFRVPSRRPAAVSTESKAFQHRAPSTSGYSHSVQTSPKRGASRSVGGGGSIGRAFMQKYSAESGSHTVLQSVEGSPVGDSILSVATSQMMRTDNLFVGRTMHTGPPPSSFSSAASASASAASTSRHPPANPFTTPSSVSSAYTRFQQRLKLTGMGARSMETAWTDEEKRLE